MASHDAASYISVPSCSFPRHLHSPLSSNTVETHFQKLISNIFSSFLTGFIRTTQDSTVLLSHDSIGDQTLRKIIQRMNNISKVNCIWSLKIQTTRTSPGVLLFTEDFFPSASNIFMAVLTGGFQNRGYCGMLENSFPKILCGCMTQLFHSHELLLGTVTVLFSHPGTSTHNCIRP